MERYLIILILSLISLKLSSQNEILIRGKVFDADTKEPVSEVHVVIKGNDRGTITDLNGNYSIYLSGKSDTLIYSHIQYNTFEKVIRKNEYNVDIYLELAVNILSNAVVKPVVNISSGMLFDVSDYCFIDDNILLSGFFYNQPKKKNPWVLLKSPLGDTIFSQSIGTEGVFYKDCFNNWHYLTEKTAYQIYMENDTVWFIHPTDLMLLFLAIYECEMDLGNKTLFRRYEADGQILVYYTHDRDTDTYDIVKIVTDEQKYEWFLMKLFYENQQEGRRPKWIPLMEDANFNHVMYSNVSAPVIKTNDVIYILNYQNSQIESYDMQFNLLNNIDIHFNDMCFSKEEIITDEVTNKVYAVIKNKNNGKTSVREILLNSGVLGDEINVPDFYWVENIKVRNNKLYFLYREKLSSKLQALYMMNLN